jgi:hypothetical protein
MKSKLSHFSAGAASLRPPSPATQQRSLQLYETVTVEARLNPGYYTITWDAPDPSRSPSRGRRAFPAHVEQPPAHRRRLRLLRRIRRLPHPHAIYPNGALPRNRKAAQLCNQPPASNNPIHRLHPPPPQRKAWSDLLCLISALCVLPISRILFEPLTVDQTSQTILTHLFTSQRLLQQPLHLLQKPLRMGTRGASNTSTSHRNSIAVSAPPIPYTSKHSAFPASRHFTSPSAPEHLLRSSPPAPERPTCRAHPGLQDANSNADPVACTLALLILPHSSM